MDMDVCAYDWYDITDYVTGNRVYEKSTLHVIFGQGFYHFKT